MARLECCERSIAEQRTTACLYIYIATQHNKQRESDTCQFRYVSNQMVRSCPQRVLANANSSLS